MCGAAYARAIRTLVLVLGSTGCGAASTTDQNGAGWRILQRHAERAPEPRREPPGAPPDLPPRASCKQARAAYVEQWELAEDHGAPDLSAGELAGVLGHGRFLVECRVPETVEVSICAAVQHGRALGVTVVTRPRSPRLERCVDASVRKLGFPAHPRMDVTRTVFRANG